MLLITDAKQLELVFFMYCIAHDSETYLRFWHSGGQINLGALGILFSALPPRDKILHFVNIVSHFDFMSTSRFLCM